MTRDLGAWGRLIFLGMVWGGSFIATAMALEGFGPATVAAGRIGIAALALVAMAVATGAGLPPLSDRRVWAFALVIAALSNAAPFVLLSWSQQHIPAGLAAILMAFLPLVVLPLSHFLLPGERLTPRKLAGFAIGTAGAIVLIGPGALAGLGGAGMSLMGQLGCLAAVTLYACGSITAKRAPQTDAIRFGAAVMTLAFIIIAPVALVWERPFDAAPSGRALTGLLWLGLLSTALAQVLLLQIIQRAGPPFLSMVNFMIPVWALVFGMLLLGETVPARALAALALIFSGVAIAQGLIGGARRAGPA